MRFAQARGGGASDEQQIADRQRPHFSLDLFREQRMHLVRLLKVARHLGAKLIASDPDIDRKAKFLPDPVFQLIGERDRIGIHMFCPCHVHKAFVDRKLLDDRRITAADIFESFGAPGI